MNTSIPYSYLYGPVPSRRLGRSLGIDLVPYKQCTYDCIYCQLGSTGNTTMHRKEYVPTTAVLAELQRKLSDQDRPDYISLAGSGEPTLHSGIGELILGIKRLTTIPVAVLTNGSLLWMPEVHEALRAADLVMPSLDAGDADTFRLVNRPHADVSFENMVAGLTTFCSTFKGHSWLEVLLLAGINDDDASVRRIAALAEQIKPTCVQLNTVCRPPAEGHATAVTHERLQILSDLFRGPVEIISDIPGPVATASINDHAHHTSILALLQRRPCTAQDLSIGLNLHLNDILKQLHTLQITGVVQETPARPGYYQPVRTQKDRPAGTSAETVHV